MTFTDPLIFAGTLVVIFTVALFASWLDGKRVRRRAAKRLRNFHRDHGQRPRLGDHLAAPRSHSLPGGYPQTGARRALTTPTTNRGRRR